MTMAFRIGLVGRDMAGTGEILSWAGQGQQVSADVEYHLTAPVDAQAVVCQLLGLTEAADANPVVPLEWDVDPGRAGFYRVTGVDFPIDRTQIRSDRVTAKLSLERVATSPGYAGEHVLWGAARAAAPTTGSWVGQAAIPWFAWPAAWGTPDVTSIGSTVLYDTRALTASAAMSLIQNFAFTYGFSVLTAPAPGSFYDGACTVRAGSPLQYVVGRRLAVDPDYWEISNGLVKIVPPTTTAAAFDIKYRNSAGTGWATRRRAAAVWYDNTYTAFAGGCNPLAVSVRRNTPELVMVRLVLPGDVTYGTHYLDLTLRRGARYVQMALSAAIPSRWAIGHETGFSGAWGAIDAPTVGSIETATDVDGNRSLLLLGSVQTAGVSFVSTGRVANGATPTYRTIEVAMGAEVSAVNTVDTAPYVERQYFAAVGETFRVVAP